MSEKCKICNKPLHRRQFSDYGDSHNYCTNKKLEKLEKENSSLKQTIRDQKKEISLLEAIEDALDFKNALHVADKDQLKRIIHTLLNCEVCGGAGVYWEDAQNNRFRITMTDMWVEHHSDIDTVKQITCQCRTDARKAVGK